MNNTTLRNSHTPANGGRSAVAIIALAALLVFALAPTVALAAPSGLTAQPAPGDVLLTWSDGAANTDYYNIYRGIAPGGPYTLAGIAEGFTYFRDSTGATSTAYYYRVASVDTSGTESGYSNEANGAAAPFTADAYEADDTSATAKTLATDGSAQAHNTHAKNNEDWAKFSAVAGQFYEIRTDKLGLWADTVLTLYRTGAGGFCQVAVNDNGAPNFASKIRFEATESVTYYIKVANALRCFGRGTSYELSAISSAGDAEGARVLSLGPVVTHVGREVTLLADVVDNVAVRRVVFEYTTDDLEDPWWEPYWSEIGTVDASPEKPAEQRVEYRWQLLGEYGWERFAEGEIVHVRARAIDYAGNDCAQEQVRDYTPDYGSPEPPVSPTWTLNETSMSITWSASPSSDVVRYAIYRSNRPGGGYGKKTTTSNRTFVDHINPVRTYCYEIRAVDGAGNESRPLKVANDRHAPTIDAFRPRASSYVHGNQYFGVDYWDNTGLRSAAYAYSTDGGGTWRAIDNPDARQFVTTDTASMPASIRFRARLTDFGGNVVETATIYSVDNVNPAAPTNCTAVATSGGVSVAWTASASSDVTHYVVETTTDDETPGEYTEWSYEAKAAASPCFIPIGSYTSRYYRVVAVDRAGNRSGGSNYRSATGGAPTADSAEPDNSAAQAKPLLLDAAAQTRTLTSPSDYDWFTFSVENTKTVHFGLQQSGGVWVGLWDDPNEFYAIAAFGEDYAWRPPAAGTYYIRVRARWSQTASYLISLLSQPRCDSFGVSLYPADGAWISDTTPLWLLSDEADFGEHDTMRIERYTGDSYAEWTELGSMSLLGRFGRYEWDTSAASASSERIRADMYGQRFPIPLQRSYNVDNADPAAPILNIPVPSGSNLVLSWERSSSPDVRLYSVFRSRDETITTWEYVTSTPATGCVVPASAETYDYQVIACDFSGRQSEPSNIVSSETEDGRPKITSFLPETSCLFRGGGELRATVDESATSCVFRYSRDQGATWRDIGEATITTTGWTLWWDTSALPSGLYIVRAYATDLDGQTSDGKPARFYYVDNTAVPLVTGVNPNSGPPDTTVTIDGSGFGDTTGTVLFNSVPASISSWDDTQVVCTVPYDASTGPLLVFADGAYSSPTMFVVPVQDAVGGTFSLNGGASHTNTTTVSAGSTITGPVTQMRFRCEGAEWTGWLGYSSQHPLTLPSGDGNKRVFAQFRDAAGNTLYRYDTITLDTDAPTGTFKLNLGAIHTKSASVHINSTVTGATKMRYRASPSDVGPWSTWSAWIDYGADVMGTLPTGDGVKWMNVEYADEAANTLSVSDSIILRAAGITGTMRINNGASYTRSRRVAVNSFVLGASVMRVYPEPGEWQLYADSAPTTLTAGDGSKTVSVTYDEMYEDNPLYLSDTIILDTSRPRTYAPYRSVARYRRYATLRYKVRDGTSNRARVTIYIKNSRRRVVKRLCVYSYVNRYVAKRFRCTLRRGTYRFYVYATDLAGNRQSRVGYNRFVVR